MSAITAIIPPTKEQAQSITQLNEYIHGLMVRLLYDVALQQLDVIEKFA